MKFPGRRDLPDSYAGARGERVEPGGDRHGMVDDGSVAWPERVELARRSWPEARAEDFQQVARRRFIDRATGLEYLAISGAPMLSVGQEACRGASCWFVQDGRIVVLRRPEFEQPINGPAGYIVERRIETAPPSEDEVHIR